MSTSERPSGHRPRQLLFLMHVDWRWIKQRPHFLAEEATRNGQRVVVLFKPHGSRLRLPRNDSAVRRVPMLPVPHSARHGRGARLGRRLQRWYVGLWVRRLHPDVLYISHPLLWSVVPERARRGATVVYDCMDDAVAMARPQERRDVADLESDLLASAAIVIASSDHLVELAASRSGRTDVHLIRNGFARDHVTVRPGSSGRTGPRKVASYVGTIAHWLDWDALMTLRDEFGGTIKLIGPIPRAGLVPEGIECPGPVEHSAVSEILWGSDLLLLPFSPSDVVLGVDPVKLYEYVAARRPIVARYFPELERFRPFVAFYEHADEIGTAMAEALSAPAPDEDAVQRFLTGQDWSDRWSALDAVISRQAEVGSQ